MSEINNTAEFGGISDVTTISKGGSNQYHGGVFENHQNSYFAARNTFSATVPKLIMNDFGGLLGWPDLHSEALQRQGQNILFCGLTRGSACPVPAGLGGKRTVAAHCEAAICRCIQPRQGSQRQSLSRATKSRERDYSILPGRAQKYLFPLPNTGPANSIVNNYVQNFPTPIKQRSRRRPNRPKHHVETVGLCPLYL